MGNYQRIKVDDWNLGSASTERNLEGMDPKTLIKAGLVNLTDTGNMGGELYRGRIIFPYLIKGAIQYMAGRVTPDTPDHDKERNTNICELDLKPKMNRYLNLSINRDFLEKTE